MIIKNLEPRVYSHLSYGLMLLSHYVLLGLCEYLRSMRDHRPFFMEHYSERVTDIFPDFDHLLLELSKVRKCLFLSELNGLKNKV